jgi:CopG family nickel-responsive transcriptional regulator
MKKLMRFGVSMEKDLLQRFDKWIAEHSWANRSEAIRDLVRQRLVEKEWQDGKKQVCATLTFVYDHHVPQLQERLTHLQHDFPGIVVGAMHVHLDHHNCLEVLVMKGPAAKIGQIADRILGTRGVKHGKLVGSMPAGGI